MSVSLVIPAYNEYLNLTILINEINNHLVNKLDYEIIIVDDCSNDDTEKLFKNNELVTTFQVAIHIL